MSRGDLGGGPGSRFRGPAPKDDPCILLGDALRDGRRDGVRGAQERGRLSVLWTLVLARRARRRVSRCSIALQLCARVGSVFAHLRARKAATSGCRLLPPPESSEVLRHAGKRLVLASSCKPFAECYSCYCATCTNQTCGDRVRQLTTLLHSSGCHCKSSCAQ